MADTKISDLTNGSTAASDDRIPIARNPYGSTTGRWITPGYIKTLFNTQNHTWSGSNTFSSAMLAQGTGHAFDGSSTLGVGAGASTLHVHTASSGATAATNGDDLVVENSGACGISILSGSTSYGQIYFGESGDEDKGYIRYDHNGEVMDINVNALSTAAIRIASDGDIGFGVASPQAKCHALTAFADGVGVTAVSADGDELLLENTTNVGMTLLSGDGAVASIFFADESDVDIGSIKYDHGDNTLFIGTNNSTKFVYNDTGLLIGRNADSQGVLNISPSASNATSSAELLVETSGNTNVAIAGGTTSNCVLNFGDSGDPAAGYVLYNNNTDHMVLKAGGIEAIQINNQGYLHQDNTGAHSVVGNSYNAFRNGTNTIGDINTVLINGGTNTENRSSFLLSCSSGAQDVAYIYGDGAASFINGVVTWSDRKIKKNIKDANSQWDDIKKYKLVNFSYTQGKEHKKLGLIAQDVERVSPGLVVDSPRPGHGDIIKTINVSALSMKMLGALKEAMERIEELERKTK